MQFYQHRTSLKHPETSKPRSGNQGNSRALQNVSAVRHQSHVESDSSISLLELSQGNADDTVSVGKDVSVKEPRFERLESLISKHNASQTIHVHDDFDYNYSLSSRQGTKVQSIQHTIVLPPAETESQADTNDRERLPSSANTVQPQNYGHRYDNNPAQNNRSRRGASQRAAQYQTADVSSQNTSDLTGEALQGSHTVDNDMQDVFGRMPGRNARRSHLGKSGNQYMAGGRQREYGSDRSGQDRPAINRRSSAEEDSHNHRQYKSQHQGRRYQNHTQGHDNDSLQSTSTGAYEGSHKYTNQHYSRRHDNTQWRGQHQHQQSRNQSARSNVQQMQETQDSSQTQADDEQPAKLEPKVLMAKLSSTVSWYSLRGLCLAHIDSFNHLHVACAMNRLAKCFASINRKQEQSELRKLMTTLEALFAFHLDRYTCREVTNVVWCWGKTGHKPSFNTAQVVVSKIVADNGALLRDHQATPQALSNLAWACAHLKWNDQHLWSTLEDAIMDSLLHSPDARDSDLIVEIRSQVAAEREQQRQVQQQQAPNHSDQSQTIQGNSSGQHQRQHHSKRRQWHSNNNNNNNRQHVWAPVDVASVMWACANTNRGSMRLRQLLAETAQTRLQDFCVQDVSMVLWSCAVMKILPQKLFAAAERTVMECIEGFSSQSLANVAWAFAQTRCASEPLMKVITRHALMIIGEMQPMHLTQIAWACFKTGVPAPRLMRAALATVITDPSAWRSHNLALLSFSLSAQGYFSAETIKELTPVLVNRVQEWIQRSDEHQQLLESQRQDAEQAQLESRHHHSTTSDTYQDRFAPGTDSHTSAAMNTDGEARDHDSTDMVVRAPLLRRKHGAWTRNELLRWNRGWTFQDLSQILWSHAILESYDPALFEGVAELCLRYKEEWVADPKAFQSIVWSLGFGRHYDQQIFDLAAQQLAGLDKSTRFAPSQVAGLLVTLASLQHYSPDACISACRYMESAVKTQPQAINTETLVNVIWSLTVLNHLDLEFMRTAFQELTRRWQEGDSSSGQTVSSAHAMTTRRTPELVLQYQQHGVLQQYLQARKQLVSDADSHAQLESSDDDFNPGSDPDSASAGHASHSYETYELVARHQANKGRRSAVRSSGSAPCGKQLAQIFQASMWLKAHPDASGRKLLQLLDPTMLKAGKSLWCEQASSSNQVTFYHQDILQVMKSMRLSVQVEAVTADGLFSVDCMLHLPTGNGRDIRVAVEADGEVHFTHTQPYRLIGSKALRDRLVKQTGMLIIDIPFWEWHAVCEDRYSARQYIRSRLHDVVAARHPDVWERLMEIPEFANEDWMGTQSYSEPAVNLQATVEHSVWR